MNQLDLEILILEQAHASAKIHQARCARRAMAAKDDYTEAVSAAHKLERQIAEKRKQRFGGINEQV